MPSPRGAPTPRGCGIQPHSLRKLALGLEPIDRGHRVRNQGQQLGPQNEGDSTPGSRRKGFGMPLRCPFRPTLSCGGLWDIAEEFPQTCWTHFLRGRVRSPRYKAALKRRKIRPIHVRHAVALLKPRFRTRANNLSVRKLPLFPATSSFHSASQSISPSFSALNGRLRHDRRPAHGMLAAWPAVPPFDQIAITHIEDQPSACPLRRIDLAAAPDAGCTPLAISSPLTSAATDLQRPRPPRSTRVAWEAKTARFLKRAGAIGPRETPWHVQRPQEVAERPGDDGLRQNFACDRP